MVTRSKAAVLDLGNSDSMVMPDLEHVSAASWFRVAVAGGQLFRALNLGVLRRTVADVHAQYEAPFLVLRESREGSLYRFGLLLQRAMLLIDNNYADAPGRAKQIASHF